MGLGDKLKDLRKQTQDAVAEHKEGIQNAVESVGAAANQRTRGKYADRIAKVGERLNATVDKLGGEQGAAAGTADADQPDAGGATSAGAGAAAHSEPGGDGPAAGSPPPDFG